jgi:GMP synthase (glutamine-hydrolysing)
MTEVLVLQHAAPEGPAAIGDALRRRGVGMRMIRIDQGASVPESLDGAAGLVVMGGPMSAYDPLPHIEAELRLIERALKEDRPILGVCLGSQLLAAALGARVYSSGRKEIGWHEVRLTDAARQDPLWQGIPERFMGFHWHGDIFDLPKGASSLASSSLTAQQAFRAGKNAYGLLFHLEVGEPQVRDMVATFSDELAAAKISGAPILEGIAAHLPPLQRIGSQVFDRWAALATKRTV